MPLQLRMGTGPSIKRGLLMAEAKDIKNKAEILDLVTAIWEPVRLASFTAQDIKKATP